MEYYKELIKDWSDQDKDWLEKAIQENFRPIAAKRGRTCFGLVMQAGITSGAGQVIVNHSQHMGNKLGNEQRHAMQTIANCVNDLLNAVAELKGVTKQQFEDCKKDIERMGALSMQVPNQKSSLILPH